ncbi:MAG TPA: DUF1294 domain-containing protein [Bacillaceae bacterium]|nr:DUF1294 domain-containing protein [Bacillaceae bacterium]
MIKAILSFYFIIINIIGIFTMKQDKQRARKRDWRISEKKLWLLAFVGAAPGLTIGMKKYRHKTKHFLFKYGLPTVAILEFLIYFYVLGRLS